MQASLDGAFENGHLRRRHASLPEGIDAAAIDLVARVGFVDAGIRTGHAHRFPQARGLRRLDALAVHLVVQQAAGRQHLVANHFRIHTEAGTARQQAILRIVFEPVGRRLGCLLVGFGHHDLFHQRFDIPPRLDEGDGQVVEQFRMAGPLALGAKIFRRLHDADTEQLLPEPVDRHPRRQRVLAETRTTRPNPCGSSARPRSSSEAGRPAYRARPAPRDCRTRRESGCGRAACRPSLS